MLGGIDADWKREAERLKFDESLSWVALAGEMAENFPGLSEAQVLEKVRRALRHSDRYHRDIPSCRNEHFAYKFERPVKLHLLGDLHVGAISHQEEALIDYIDSIRFSPDSYLVLLGDLIDNATLHGKSCIYRQALIPQAQKERAIEILRPVSDRILLSVMGNHEERTFSQTGSDIMYDICSGLGILDRYAGVKGYLTITMKDKTYKLYCAHNLGKTEAALRQKARCFSDVDILLGGHIHNPKTIWAAQKSVDGQRDILVGICNSWLLDEDYAIFAAYDPASLRPTVIELSDGIRCIT